MKNKTLTIAIVKSILLFSLFQIVLYFILSDVLPVFSIPVAISMTILYAFYNLFNTFYTFKRIEPIISETQKITHLNSILYQLISKSVTSNSMDELYQHILESAIDALPVSQKGCILLLNQETNLLEFVAMKGYDAEILKSTFLKLEQTYMYRESIGKVARTIMIHDVFGYDRQQATSENMEQILSAGSENVMSTLSTPIIYNDQLYGMINIDSSSVDAFTDSDKHIIELFAMEVVHVIKLFNTIEQINYISNHDQLTKIYNRNYFNEYIPTLLSAASRESDTVMLISIDLNNLKYANDTFGHTCGDQLLSHFTNIFSLKLPKEGFFFRYGGDEFFLLFKNYTFEQAETLMLEFQNYVANDPLTFQSSIVPMSFCYGYSQFPTEADTLDSLMKIADERMYTQKRQYHLENN